MSHHNPQMESKFGPPQEMCPEYEEVLKLRPIDFVFGRTFDDSMIHDHGPDVPPLVSALPFPEGDDDCLKQHCEKVRKEMLDLLKTVMPKEDSRWLSNHVPEPLTPLVAEKHTYPCKGKMFMEIPNRRSGDGCLNWVHLLCTSKGIQKLDISRNNLTTINVFADNTTIVDLRARGNNLEASGIVEVLNINTTMTKLCLQSNKLADDAAQLLSNMVSNITRLKVQDNPFTNEGMAAIASNPKIKRLAIGNKHLGQKTITVLSKNQSITKLAFWADVEQSDLEPLSNCVALQSLYIKNKQAMLPVD